jgi:hypothetical protein
MAELPGKVLQLLHCKVFKEPKGFKVLQDLLDFREFKVLKVYKVHKVFKVF